ncbi:hypothetical protein FGG08_007425 [Glutinoglossum americanum]|uniref:Uncharacterized protein n=1 Tax=Glutinoglossum americanum TaxID=1670608 RepID=A0A9P8HWB7_9PEZI|nr:hypothetical protein FGG08_007425 [Glutinoglossum americanum]
MGGRIMHERYYVMLEERFLNNHFKEARERILGAFLIDDYKDERNEKEMELSYLADIREDLVDDTITYLWRLGDLDTTELYSDSLLTIQKLKQKVPDRLAAHFGQLYSILIGINFQNSPSYESMKSSGYLRLIHDKELARDLNQYYSHGRFIDIAANEELRRITEVRRNFRNKSGLFVSYDIDAETATRLLNTPELYNIIHDSRQSIKFVTDVLKGKVVWAKELIEDIDRYKAGT